MKFITTRVTKGISKEAMVTGREQKPCLHREAAFLSLQGWDELAKEHWPPHWPLVQCIRSVFILKKNYIYKYTYNIYIFIYTYNIYIYINIHVYGH